MYHKNIANTATFVLIDKWKFKGNTHTREHTLRACFASLADILLEFVSFSRAWRSRRRRKIVSRHTLNERKREFPAYGCTRATSDSDWRRCEGRVVERRKIICTASLLADPISGSTDEAWPTIEVFLSTLQVHAIRIMADMRATLFVRSHELFSYEFLNRPLFSLNKGNARTERIVTGGAGDLQFVADQIRCCLNQSSWFIARLFFRGVKLRV